MDHQRPHLLTISGILGSFIKQLCIHHLRFCTQLSPGLCQQIRKSFREKGLLLASAVAFNVFSKLLQLSRETCVVLDGLDEMPHDEGALLLDTIRRALSANVDGCNLKFALFSREHVNGRIEIRNAFQEAIHIPLSLDLVRDDISKFIDRSITHRNKYERKLTDDAKLLDELAAQLKENAEKM
jgi:hypothetical protein